METTESITIILLGAGLLVLCVLLLAVWRVGGSLLRLERLLLAEREDAVRQAEGQAAVDAVPLQRTPTPARDGAFLEFLSEDPERKKLPKREQFEVYRQWRKQRGLNWSNP